MTTHKMGENICKWSNQQGINLQNIQTAHAALSLSLSLCVCVCVCVCVCILNNLIKKMGKI